MPNNLNVDPNADASMGVTPSARGPIYDEDRAALENEDSDISDAVASEDDDEEAGDLPLTSKDDNDEEDSDEDDADGNKKDDEDEDEDEEDDDDKTPIPFDRPSVREIKAEFPDFFKKFPQLKESFFREIEFTKLFPTIEDAREAFDDNEAFSTLSDAVLSGDPAPLLDSIEKTDKDALEVFSLSFLKSLHKKNPELYTQAITPIFQNLVKMLYSSKDQNTQNAACVIGDYLFGDGNGEPVGKGEKNFAKNVDLDESRNKIKKDRDEATAKSFRVAHEKVTSSVNTSLEKLVMKSPLFDPNKVFSPFLRKQGAREVIDRVKKKLVSDNGHMQVMAARWKHAKSKGYGSDEESKIVSTYLARAKSLIAQAASEVSGEMLGTKKSAASKRQEKVKTFPRENHSGRASSDSNRGPAKVDYNKMSDMEILNS